MKGKQQIFKDVKRSLGLFLALILILSGIASVPVGASEQLKIMDNGGMIGICYADDMLHQVIEEVYFDDVGNVSMSDTPVLKAELYLRAEGSLYKVMEYSSEPAYDQYDYFGISSVLDGGYRAMLVPVYYGTPQYSEALQIYKRSKISSYNDVARNYLDTVISCDDDPFCGYSDEILEYFNVTDNFDMETMAELLLSEEYVNQYCIKYTLSDSLGNTTGCTKTNISLYDYEMDAYIPQPPGLYLFGKRVGYNRIEDLSQYHINGKYEHLKMYKGNIYVNADELTELGEELSIPNVNKSGLYNLNSVYIDGEILYNDGYSKNNIISGFNLLDYVIPSPVDTKNEAVDEFLEIICGKYYTSSDFSSWEEYDRYFATYYQINNYMGHTYKSGDYLMTVNAFSEYEYGVYYPTRIIKSESMSFVAACENYNDKAFTWQSIGIPEIDVTTLNESYAQALREYIIWTSNEFDSEDIIYEIMSGDEVVSRCSVYNAGALFYSIADALNNEGCNTISELPDDSTYFAYDIEKNVKLNTITDIVPVSDVLENDYMEIKYLSNYDVNDVKNILDDVGLEYDALKVWLQIKEEVISYSATYKDDLVNTLINEFGADAFTDFVRYIEDNFVTQDNYLVSVTENDASQKNTNVDVYNEELKIPLSFFENAELGAEKIISQFWYAGYEKSYLVPIHSSNAGEKIIYYGEYIHKDYERYAPTMMPISNMLGKIYELKYDRIWNTALGTVVLAKVPDQIEEQNNISLSSEEIEITWDVPNDNGAEILGYQIAVVPHSNTARALPSDDQYITVGDKAGSYTDIGDNYDITYTTDTNSYIVDTNGKSVDVYVRAVNVIGAAKPQVISIIDPTAINITGPDNIKAGNTANYDVLNIEQDNVESDCTYSLDSEAGVSISADGTLNVSSDCTLRSVTITAVGKAGSDYEGKNVSMVVSIEALEDDTPDNIPDDTPDDTPEDTPDDDNLVNPDTGRTIVGAAIMVIIAGVALVIISNKKLKCNVEK